MPKRCRLGLYEAIMAYGLDGIEPEALDKKQKAAFILIKPVLETGQKKAKAGRFGAAVTNRQRHSKGEKEKEIEIEVEVENEIETETENDSLWREGFGEFWELYPVKLGKEKAEEAWKRLMPDAGAVCDGLRQWVQTKQWTKDGGQFIPRAAKFLEERHYEHLPADYIPKGASGVLGKAELEAIERIMAE